MEKLNKLSDLSNYIETVYDDRVFKRGEIYYVDLEDINEITTHISHKTRPALIIQNDKGNMMSQNLIVALLTGANKRPYPFQYKLNINGKDTTIMFEQLLSIDKERVLDKYYELSSRQMIEAEECLMYSLQLDRYLLTNLVDLEISSVTTRKTLNKEYVFLEVNLILKNGQNNIIKIGLDKLRRFNDKITKDTNFNEIKSALDCCKGLNFLLSNAEY